MLRALLPLTVLSALALTGCPSQPPPATYAIADWQVRCDSAMLACTPGPSRLVTGTSGVDGNSVSCSVVESATTRRVNFRVGSSVGGIDYAIGVAMANVPRSGGSPSTGCTVTVEDDANTYVGACGATAPSDTQPCQVTMDFDVDPSTGSPRVTAEILCDHLVNQADPTIRRSIFMGAGSPNPAHIEIFDCRGLSGAP
jgi:hypothetical protein